jgi:hypothetical protein
MKTIKLKPIFFPNDDILVKPPSFIGQIEDFPIEKLKNRTVSSTGQLANILKSRQLKKQNKTQTNIREDEETVKKLSDWKRIESPTSPLRRKFTYKRTATMQLTAEGKVQLRPYTASQTIAPVRINQYDALVTAVQGIVAIERLKRKALDAEIKKVSDQNREMENIIKAKIIKTTKEIEELKTFIRLNSERLEKMKKELNEINRKYEEDLNSIHLKEAQELLFDKGKKKAIKPGEETLYLINKEKIRQMKQEVHKNYQEAKDKYVTDIESSKKILEIAESHRIQSKNELKSYKEDMILLYCRTLKDGKDLRSDGLRWVIKALWKMNDFVPISAFPKFFDDESSTFLLIMSEKDLELEDYTKRLNALRQEIKNKKNVSISTTRDLYTKVRTRLRNITQSSIGQLLDGSSFIEDPNQSINDGSKNNITNYNEISIIRDKIFQLTEYVKESTAYEIKRVTENYQKNPGDAEHVGLFHIIKCLVGDKVREFNKYTRSTNPQKKRISLLVN